METKPTTPPAAAASAEETKRWGTRHMGPPAPPNSHPENQQAAVWGPHRPDDDEQPHPTRGPSPYVVMDEPSRHTGSPMESILDAFESWTKKAETLATNVWANLKTSHSIPDAAWGKLSLTAKAVSEGGFEPLFRRAFRVDDPSERLRKTFACYLSTAAGPVAGTLYLSTARLAFCSDRPLSFAAPSGQEAWSYYKVAVPLGKVAAVTPVTAKENPPPPERYVEVVTVDGHEFWFMGFVNYGKAVTHLCDAVADFMAAAAAAAGPRVGPGEAGGGCSRVVGGVGA